MSKKGIDARSVMIMEVDPTECPFREFRDSELSIDWWGMGPAAQRAAMASKTSSRPPADYVWLDDQTQPLPRSVRHYLNGWVRAEYLAADRWDAEVVVFVENNGGRMRINDIQLSHAQVLHRSSFCRKVLSACYILEKVEGFVVEHQWENFIFTLPPEGWRARYHIYSPGMKSGGGPQHRPGLSKTGCYLVRLYWLGAWRCVWVSDQVPVDSTDSPLLPFSPLLTSTPFKQGAAKQAPGAITTTYQLHLWPLLLCKALLKLAAPDMNSDEDMDCLEDELISEFDIFHALTGCVRMKYNLLDCEKLWDLITSEVQMFSWDEDDDTQTSTIKSKATKKPNNKETVAVRRGSFLTILLADSKHCQPYVIPGITPCQECDLLVATARDLPLKKPLPEPEVPLWKHYRWIDWAKSHGLYDDYECPRTRFLKVCGLMKLSYAPHLLDVQSTESITVMFREEQDKTIPTKSAAPKKPLAKDGKTSNSGLVTLADKNKEELREWVLYEQVQKIIKQTSVLYYPSAYEYTTASSSPPFRITKAVPNRALDIIPSKSAPLYCQIDGSETIRLRISLNVLNPRILINSAVPVLDYIEPAYIVVEVFEWFHDTELSEARAFVETAGYDTVELSLLPGRHFLRIWIHSRTNWQAALMTESKIYLGQRDFIQSLAVNECHWVSKFLSNLGMCFTNWIKASRSNPNISLIDREFYRSYQPDLEWDPVVTGYKKPLLHWMFRRALEIHLFSKLTSSDFHNVCKVLRKYFMDPDFGMPEKPEMTRSLREAIIDDPCDCAIGAPEEISFEENIDEQEIVIENKPVIDPITMEIILLQPSPEKSNVCDMATEEIPCEVLKEEREKYLRKHDAATYIQALWRGTWARKCLRTHVSFSTDIYKTLMENAFGHHDTLSSLMTQFFQMYPETKYAYSIASGLGGVCNFRQYSGTVMVTPKCKWVPYFQGVFYCHAPVKVHFDIAGSLQHQVFAIYNNDNDTNIEQAFNAHKSFDFQPNKRGYTVMGHGMLNRVSNINADVHWQLTVLASTADVFHLCDDNVLEPCKEIPMSTCTKFRLDEMYVPNRRNILGGMTISVMKRETVSFRAAASSPEIMMQATLKEKTEEGNENIIGYCHGKGELYWPYIKLAPAIPSLSNAKRSTSTANLNMRRDSTYLSARSSLKAYKLKPSSAGGKTRSTTKFKEVKPVALEPKQYWIEVTAVDGWPLTIDQWRRVDEVMNSVPLKVETPLKGKALMKEKGGSAKDREKEKDKSTIFVHVTQPGDAYVELECALPIGAGIIADRDDDRDRLFLETRKSWAANDPLRNSKGANIRKEFRDEYLEAPPLEASSLHTPHTEEGVGEELLEEDGKTDQQINQQGPSPVSDSANITVESEEEAKYFEFPEQLKDKFVPLYFIPFCTLEKTEEECTIITPEIAEAAKTERNVRIKAGLERMKDLQSFDDVYVLGRQKHRCYLLEKLCVDSQWNPDLAVALEERDDAIALETLNRNLSATKKKDGSKKK